MRIGRRGCRKLLRAAAGVPTSRVRRAAGRDKTRKIFAKRLTCTLQCINIHIAVYLCDVETVAPCRDPRPAAERESRQPGRVAAAAVPPRTSGNPGDAVARHPRTGAGEDGGRLQAAAGRRRRAIPSVDRASNSDVRVRREDGAEPGGDQDQRRQRAAGFGGDRCRGVG